MSVNTHRFIEVLDDEAGEVLLTITVDQDSSLPIDLRIRDGSLVSFTWLDLEGLRDAVTVLLEDRPNPDADD